MIQKQGEIFGHDWKFQFEENLFLNLIAIVVVMLSEWWCWYFAISLEINRELVLFNWLLHPVAASRGD